jgi:Restriction endonuclease EcoRII, N-terminal
LNKSLYKVLTDNDIGITGSHQAGITVPRKDGELLGFFPELDLSKFNPEAWIYCIDPSGVKWKMRYIYYNGKTFSPNKSTRNEYRITHTIKVLKKLAARKGDLLIFTETGTPNNYRISIQKKLKEEPQPSENQTIVLRGWSKVY